MAKLWAKNYQVNSVLEDFTTGRDYLLDRQMVSADCLASIAHGAGLHKIGVLSAEDFGKLKTELIHIIQLWQKGEFSVEKQHEDCHTSIENYLTKQLGDAGKKIHTGRSRNDQVVTMMRVYGRSQILNIRQMLNDLTTSLLSFAQSHKDVPMPGRTHMQIAMPSSVGLWAAAFAEELADLSDLLSHAYNIWNQNPLGAAASYGVPLDLDRYFTGSLLGFPKVQNNVLYVINSRGKLETMILDILDQIGLTLSKVAQDLILFSLPEFGYFTLPDELCTGSSIMPQKKNPDGLELMRGKSASLGGYSQQVKNVLRSLPSGYNRDSQETKEPFLLGLDTSYSMLAITKLTFDKLVVNEEALKAAFSPEIYATDAALKLVAQGVSFRDAYKEVGMNLDKYKEGDPIESLNNRTYDGTAGKLNLDPCSKHVEEMDKLIDQQIRDLSQAYEALTNLSVDPLTLTLIEE
ncbi:argininosuccinate lyase [Spirochaeta cellobiosiphila]|uniref:argininosuccinate lyase n=1 Tax=Spirochaeta cellobiosiphila TaxID=504483 RepID=UPI000414E892|nr:argininosuccinate lyase [Spirochaeta cellobiosiphila]